MEYLFEEKVALVTGGASGIGAAISRLLVKNGAKVVIADIQVDEGQKMAKELNKEKEQAIYVETDVSDPDQCRNMVEEAVRAFGRLDIAINNAGVGDDAATGEKEIESWNRVININLNGVFYGMRYQIPEILKQEGGAIVNISSILGQVGFPTASAYVAAKHGVVGLTKTAALEYAESNLRINAIGPAFINTPLLDALDKDTKDMLVGMHPAGRFGEAEEVAELAVWLCSDKASYCHGSYYPIDGGYLAR